MTAPTYKHIIWDWNGTLLNDAWLCVDVMNDLLARRSMPTMTLERYQEVFGFPVIDYYRRLGFDLEAEPFEISGTEFIVGYEKRRHEARLQPNAKITLRKVHRMGMTQSLLSAYKQKTLNELTRELGVEKFFARVIGLDDHYAYGKVENGKRWMQELCSGVTKSVNSVGDLKYEPSDILFVGDTVHDQEVAQAMGIDCVLIAGGHQTRAKLHRCGAEVLGSLPDVIAFLKHSIHKGQG